MVLEEVIPLARAPRGARRVLVEANQAGGNQIEPLSNRQRLTRADDQLDTFVETAEGTLAEFVCRSRRRGQPGDRQITTDALMLEVFRRRDEETSGAANIEDGQRLLLAMQPQVDRAQNRDKGALVKIRL